MAQTHELKSWIDFFEPVLTGEKTFELRKDDRGFRVGDILHLREYDERTNIFTGRNCKRRVTFTLWGVGTGGIAPLCGLARGYVIMGLEVDNVGS